MRTVAWTLLIIPGIITGIGIKYMRDTFFGILNPIFPFLWLQFLVGSLTFLLGISFIGGFVLYRERKKNAVKKHSSKRNKKYRSNS